jgi:hypothetical protein
MELELNVMPTALERLDELPRLLGPKAKLRWRAWSPTNGRVSPSYTVSVKNREVYVSQRGMRDIKVSLHKSGEAHLAFHGHDNATEWQHSKGSIHLSKWSTKYEFHPGWRRLLDIVHPEHELRLFNEEGLEGLDVVDLPDPAGMALHVCLLVNTDAGMNTKVNFLNAIHVATIDDDNWRLHVMAILEPWLPVHRDWARKARLVSPGSHSKSLAAPGFNRQSPAARLTKLVTVGDGGKWLVDLAANEPDA